MSVAPVRSPCVSVCRMDAASGWCEGCLRTLDEIAVWADLPDAARLLVWHHIGQRRAERRRLAAVAAASPPLAPPLAP